MKQLTGFLLCTLLFTFTLAMYDGHSDVVELTLTNFQSRVIDSDDIWIVEFYAPWCGHCQSFASEYSKAASALKGVVKVGAVNADDHKSLGGQYGVKGFPTVKIFAANKKSPQDYGGPRTAQGLVETAFKELRKTVDARMGGKTSGGGSSSGGSKKDVVELTDSNFQEMVMKSDDLWLVEFFAPWCGHCQRLEPHWTEAATALKGKVKLGTLDATVHTVISNKYNIRGFPTIKFFPGGKKSDPEEYDGGRTAEDIISWASDKASDSAPPPEIQELTSESVLKDACEGHQLCVVSVLPQLLDCQSDCRNGYIKTLAELGDKFKRNRWGWIWTEAMQQHTLEESLDIGGFGYPAMAILNVRKMKFSILRGSFSYDGINEFLRAVALGRGSSLPMKGGKLPLIENTEPWDGKDAMMPVEEEIDLSDVSLDDDEPVRKTEL